MEPKLPRLLEEGRIEVRLSNTGGTQVFEESGIDRLLKHLLEAKELLKPVEPGSSEGKKRLYLERKLDVARVAKVVLPYLMGKADKADEQDEEVAAVTVSSLYSACNVLAFIENLEMYEKDTMEEMARLKRIETAAKAIANNAEECDWEDGTGFAASLDYLSDLNDALDEGPRCPECG